MRKTKLLTAALATMMALMLLTGCMNNPKPLATVIPQATVNPVPSVLPTETVLPSPSASVLPETSASVLPEGTTAPGTDTLGANETAKKVVDELDKMSEVKKSTVVVQGDTALVGLEFQAQYKGELTSRIREMVAEKVKAVDANVTKVAVTADAEDYKKISEMATSAEGGTLAADMVNAMKQMTERILG